MLHNHHAVYPPIPITDIPGDDDVIILTMWSPSRSPWQEIHILFSISISNQSSLHLALIEAARQRLVQGHQNNLRKT